MAQDFWKKKKDPNSQPDGRWCPVCKSFNHSGNIFCINCGKTLFEQGGQSSDGIPHGSSEIGSQEINQPDDILPRDDIINRDDILPRDDIINRDDILPRDDIINRDDILPRDDIINRDDAAQLNMKMQRKGQGQENKPLEIRENTENIPRIGQVPEGLPPLEIKDTENIPRIGQLPEERKLDPSDIQVGNYCPVCMAWIPIENKFCTKCGNPYQHPEPKKPPLQEKPAALEGKPWGTFVPTSGGASHGHQASRKSGGALIWERWYSWLPILIGIIIGIFMSFGNWIQIPLGTWISLLFPPERTEIILPDPVKSPTPKPREYSGADTPTPTVRVISLDDSSQDDSVYVPPVSNDTEDMCAVFNEIEILKTMMMRMKDCNPSLTFYFKMDTDIPGLADPSSGDWEYWVDLGGHEGFCFLDPSYPDRLYCRADISASDAFTRRHLDLFAYGCDEPIFSKEVSIPELEGCGESPPGPDSSSCTLDEPTLGYTKESCEAIGGIFDDAFYCYCP